MKKGVYYHSSYQRLSFSLFWCDRIVQIYYGVNGCKTI